MAPKTQRGPVQGTSAAAVKRSDRAANDSEIAPPPQDAERYSTGFVGAQAAGFAPASPGDPPPPFADWANPGGVMLLRPEPCLHCPGKLLVAYYFEIDGTDLGWGVQPLSRCGRPDRCGVVVLGCTFAEALGQGAGR